MSCAFGVACESGWVRCSRCVVKLLGGIGRFERTCGVPVKLLGRGFGCIRPSSCLVAGCTLLVGVVKMTGGSEQAVASCSDCKEMGSIARDLGSSCGAGTTYRQFAWRRVVAFIVGRVAGCECCLLCRQFAWRHRVVSCCSALPESGRLARVADLGRSCQAAWQGRWLHLAVKLLGGRVHIVSWCRPAVWWH